jgi:uncharacterized protein (UPF0548 family)
VIGRRQSIEEIHARQSAAALTYDETGATASGCPDGYDWQTVSKVIGEGRDAFERAGDFILSFGAQRSLGMRVFPQDARATPNLTILMHSPIIKGATRIVYVNDNDTERGFAYGTLPLHPEAGEEYFGVRIDDKDVVWAEIRAFSRPNWRVLRPILPLVGLAQRLAVRRYVHAIRQAAHG